jgi:hypothetical protein
MPEKHPDLASIIMSGQTTFTKGSVTYSLRGSASESRALIEKSAATGGRAKAVEHAADDDPPEPVRLRGELLEEFESRHYRWMRGVTESPAVVKTFVEPPQPPAAKVNPALQRPETPHAKEARIGAETIARRQAAAGPTPVKLARVLEPFEPEPAEHLLRAPASVHETHSAMRMRLAREQQARDEASQPTRPSKIAARLERARDASKGAA